MSTQTQHQGLAGVGAQAPPRRDPAAPGFRLPTIVDDGPVRPIPFARLVRVEIRKQFDTLAGRWFLIAIGLIIAGVITIMLFVEDGNHSYSDYLMSTSTPLAVLVPVLGILTATSEWSQRTAMTTFSLEPRRGRVVLAKIVSTLFIGVVAFALAMVLAAAGRLAADVFRGADVPWGLDWVVVLALFLVLMFSVAQGLAFGLALLNTPAAIVAYFVVPALLGMLGALVSWFGDVAEWIDPSVTMTPLMSGQMPAGDEWSRIGVSMAIWIGVPLAIGVWRVLRREVK